MQNTQVPDGEEDTLRLQRQVRPVGLRTSANANAEQVLAEQYMSSLTYQNKSKDCQIYFAKIKTFSNISN